MKTRSFLWLTIWCHIHQTCRKSNHYYEYLKWYAISSIHMCPYVIWPEKEFISSEDNYQILIGLSAMQNNNTFGYSPLHLLLVCCARILFSRTYVDNRNVPSTHTTPFWRLYTTSITLKRRRMDVKTTLCAYWVTLEPTFYVFRVLLHLFYQDRLFFKLCVWVDMVSVLLHTLLSCCFHFECVFSHLNVLIFRVVHNKFLSQPYLSLYACHYII